MCWGSYKANIMDERTDIEIIRDQLSLIVFIMFSGLIVLAIVGMFFVYKLYGPFGITL